MKTPHRTLLALACVPLAFPLAAAELRDELKSLPYKVTFESYRDDNWEICQVNADGSRLVNLTRTPKIHEMYPQVSPDGSKLAFTVDEGEGTNKIRNVYAMDYDGKRRVLVARNARYPFWNAAGTGVMYVPGELEGFTLRDYASKGLMTWDVATRKVTPHPNPAIEHLYNLCSTPDGKWIVATVHAGMNCKHGILAVEANGDKVVNLGLPGCRPDVSPDGKRVAWGANDFELRVGDLDFTGPGPKVVNVRCVVATQKPVEAYHVDWSPDGRYLAFASGMKSEKKLAPAPEFIGVVAAGWHIFVADASASNRFVQITTDGVSNKEPDWVPLPKGK